MAEAEVKYPGLKTIKCNSHNIDNPDDPSMPYKLEMRLSPPDFMAFTFVCLYGGTEILVIRSETEEEINQFVADKNYEHHPRLISLKISDPAGVIKEIVR